MLSATTCLPSKAVTTPFQLQPPLQTSGTADYVWYSAYGSNMHLERLNYYLCGGKPPGGARTYPGCRDATPPLRSSAVMLPGRMYFALESQAWTGGMAFYDPAASGLTAARAYLISLAQFSDIAAQEMYQAPGSDLDLTEVLTTGKAAMGPGRYETLVYPGHLECHPVLTFTAPWHIGDVELNKPAGRYLKFLASGLAEAHGWSTHEIASYLASCPGAEGEWTITEIERLIQDGSL
jgi:hypothetical protein